METLIMHPENEEQLLALKAIAIAFKTDFDVENQFARIKAIELYGKEAADAIERGEEDMKAGRVTRIKDVNNIWESIF